MAVFTIAIGFLAIGVALAFIFRGMGFPVGSQRSYQADESNTVTSSVQKEVKDNSPPVWASPVVRRAGKRIRRARKDRKGYLPDDDIWDDNLYEDYYNYTGALFTIDESLSYPGSVEDRAGDDGDT